MPRRTLTCWRSSLTKQPLSSPDWLRQQQHPLPQLRCPPRPAMGGVQILQASTRPSRCRAAHRPLPALSRASGSSTLASLSRCAPPPRHARICCLTCATRTNLTTAALSMHGTFPTPCSRARQTHLLGRSSRTSTRRAVSLSSMMRTRSMHHTSPLSLCNVALTTFFSFPAVCSVASLNCDAMMWQDPSINVHCAGLRVLSQKYPEGFIIGMSRVVLVPVCAHLCMAGELARDLHSRSAPPPPSPSAYLPLTKENLDRIRSRLDENLLAEDARSTATSRTRSTVTPGRAQSRAGSTAPPSRAGSVASSRGGTRTPSRTPSRPFK
eukprot:m.126406 g.126406  ORF g.126406 m.126406 type:complete len:324 (-) comp9706_c2_seq2:129-1100(-)